MARRRSSGVLAVLAEAQRQQARQREEQRRAAVAAQRQYEREQREAQRAAAQGQKEALRAYQQGREADAARRTAELEERVAALRGVLRSGLGGPVFALTDLQRPVVVPPFDPGPLGNPVPMPDRSRYLVPPLTGVQALNPTARRQYDEQVAHAQTRFEQDWHAAQAAEEQRRRQLDRYRAQYEAWAAERRRASAGHAEQAARLAAELRGGSADAVAEFFETALGWREDWPEGFPQDCAAAWDEAAGQLVVDWRLPGFEVVPEVARYRYVKSTDQESEVARSATERRAVYREVLAQCALRVLAELFLADAGERLASVVFNGYLEAVDPATGRQEQRYLVSVAVERAVFGAVALDRVDPVECLEHGLRGRLSPRPEKSEPVRTERLTEEVGTFRADASAEDPDLFEMDPLDFEKLLAELFRRLGYQTRTTERSGDDGVDVIAENPDPITGGLYVIQAKRYRKTVSPTAVRDLDATMAHFGANKGILVTTSGFGPGSRRWVEGKPLTLIDGPMLVQLLRENGLPGRLGPATVSVPAQPVPARAGAAAEPVLLAPGANVVLPAAELAELSVRFGSAGAEADLTLLLLTAQGTVRGDGDFVFYHQPSAERGAVALLPRQASDGRSTEGATVRLPSLPAAVHRVAVSVNMDTDSGVTCAELRDALLEVHGAGGSAWAFRPPADPAVSAMIVAELYRYRAGTPDEVWKLRAVGQGWADGLAGLVRAHGVDVS
ncbi:restriction endonuclease [Kitasatospora sp. HPMI-4]|uniref:restriction endonuclease n=1 Tax=Kitasatospora sp. HPMI-4 TaxID=3448443 RepID=UPI003F1AD195